MRKTLGIVLGILIVGAFAQPLRADTFTITLFDGTSTTVDGTGSFTFSGGTFSNFTITWSSVIFDFTSAANSTPSETRGCDGGMSISFFTYLTNADCQAGGSLPGQAWEGIGNPPPIFGDLTLDGVTVEVFACCKIGPGQFGDFKVTNVQVPEPGVMFLLSTALIAMAFVGRKRIVQALQSPS